MLLSYFPRVECQLILGLGNASFQLTTRVYVIKNVSFEQKSITSHIRCSRPPGEHLPFFTITDFLIRTFACKKPTMYPETTPVHKNDGKEESPIPIAIVGMACRLPGGVSSTDDLWEICAQGRSDWSKVPKSRFDQKAFYHPNLDKPGCVRIPS